MLTDTFDQVIKHMQPQAGCYVFHSHTTQAQFEQALITSGFEIKKQLIRNKPSVNHIGGDYKQKHEPFFYCSIKDNQPSFYADCREITVIDLHGDMSDDEILKQIKHARDAESKGMTTIWSMKRHNVMDYEHPTQKPVGLVVVGLQNSSRTGEIILDPFGGSGTTLIASEKTGRSCHMMELDPKYIEVIIARYARYTNNTKPMKCLTRDISIEEIIENV